jgi:beta-lactam-binding protein with PASTA domain
MWFVDSVNSAIGRIALNAPLNGFLCVVPSVKGNSFAQAKTALTHANCKLGKVTAPKPKHGYRLVVSKSSPAAGKSVPGGSKVNLTLVRKK